MVELSERARTNYHNHYTLLHGRTGVQTGLYALEMIPRGLNPFSGPTRSRLHGNVKLAHSEVLPIVKLIQNMQKLEI